MSVSLHYQSPLSLTNRTALKNFITEIFKREKTAVAHVSIIFCSNDFLLNINKEFLNHDFFTDIITFNLAATKQPVMGELYISVDMVRYNSSLIGSGFNTELHRVIFHGLLHLCGYNDKTKSEKALIREKEDYYLMKYLNVPRITVS